MMNHGPFNFDLIYPAARKKANTAVLTLAGVRFFQYCTTLQCPFIIDVKPPFMLTIYVLCKFESIR